MARDYLAAIDALNTLQTNFSVLDAIRKSGGRMNDKAIPEMVGWCRRAGHEPHEFNKLNVIHIAGTKGKGSTSAFVSSILQQYALTRLSSTLPTKIGLYTSPHLRTVRERIQINSRPLPEDVFTRYFFRVWDRLEASAAQRGLSLDESKKKPVYFRYLTLMAMHAFLEEGVDTAVIECGVGGEYDSTNVVEKPVACGVTSLGIDHVGSLGKTIEEIAWHKAGIFKSESRVKDVYTIESQRAIQVLKMRAEAKGLRLRLVPTHPDIRKGRVRLGLDADFQKMNASLAIALASAHLRALGIAGVPEPLSTSPLPPEFRKGLETVQWGGRCETRKERNLTWYLDGAHTLDSMRLVAEWFGSQISALQQSQQKVKRTRKRILVFNQQTRDAPALARSLYASLFASVQNTKSQMLPAFTHAVFCTNVTFSAQMNTTDIQPIGLKGNGYYKRDLASMSPNPADVSQLRVQRQLAEVWHELSVKRCKCEVKPNIEEAVAWVREIAKGTSNEGEGVSVLVTGSLHLVGGVLEVLESAPNSQNGR